MTPIIQNHVFWIKISPCSKVRLKGILNLRLLPKLLMQVFSSHPLVQEDQCLQEVIDSSTDLLRGEAVQQQLQGLHPLCHQVDAPILHRAGQEAQQTWVPQGLQVLPDIKGYRFRWWTYLPYSHHLLSQLLSPPGCSTLWQRY